MKTLPVLVVLCVLCCAGDAAPEPTNNELADAIKQLKKDMKADLKASNRAAETLVKTYRTQLRGEINDLKLAMNTKIEDLKVIVNTNKQALLQTIQTEREDVSGDIAGLSGTFTSTKLNINQQLASIRTQINIEKKNNNKTIKKVYASIANTRNASRKSVQGVWKNLNKHKEDVWGEINDVKTNFNKKLNDLKDYVNVGKNNSNNFIRTVRTMVHKTRNDTRTGFQNVWTNLKEYKLDVKDVMTNMRDAMEQTKQIMVNQVTEIQEENEVYRGTIKDLARQTMLVQFGMEERVRSDGDSGIKLTRGMSKGPDNYYETGIFGPNLNMIHDHSDFDRTMGMGEVITVLNGVEFRTRHNDYKLKMASTTSTDFHATEDIPFPGVPPAVTGTVDEQITEMREWFKAFATQNKTHRNYPEYFKPVLCYMEGSWTLDTKNLEEPFDSDRHQIDASSWFDLQEKVRFASYTGTKSRLENFANLPTTIMSVNDTTGLPQYAQWNYRILCNPLKEDIPTKEFRQMDDLAFRIPRKRSQHDASLTRGGRYRLYEEEEDKYTRYSKLDRLFYTIPGKDNIPGDLRQESFGDTMIDLASDNGTLLNTGFYHRFFKFDKSGAMGLKAVSRGFNDANMWVAQTTQERIAPIKMKVCGRRNRCTTLDTRFSYAIPLEVVYMTPLLSWNPYDFETGKTEKEVKAGGRTGRLDQDLAFNGTGPKRCFFMTPSEFFQGKVDQSDPADTVRNAVGVLDKQGVMRKVTASGTKIFLQEIEGIAGRIRLRYPISPIHGEGSPVWKELNALKKVIKDQEGSGGIDMNSMVVFTMSTTNHDPPGEHTHEFSIDMKRFLSMYLDGEVLLVKTSESHNHRHKLRVDYLENEKRFVYNKCDGSDVCWDGHPRKITLITDVTGATDKMMMNPMMKKTSR